MKKILSFILIALAVFSFSSCGSNNNSGEKGDKNTTKQVDNNQNKAATGFIKKDYNNENELYAFIKTFLDFKEPAMNALSAKKSSFKDTVALLSEGDSAIDIPINPLQSLQNLEKTGSSWNGKVSVYNYDITKSGKVYNFKFTHTFMNEVTEGSCDVEKGVLQLVVSSDYTTQKYQVKALGNGEYLRFWSEKSTVSELTRAHYTYFKENDAAVGQEETLSPKELVGNDYKNETYVENDEAWLKLIGGKTSDFDGVNK